MPSHLHEVLITMFRDRPELAAEVLAGPLGMSVPPFQQAKVSSSDLTDVAATEYRADAVVTLTASDGPALAVIIEVQLRVDARKRRTWPAYVATLHARDYLEALMTTTEHRYQSDFARRYFDRGQAEGKAEDVLAILDARGIETPDDVRADIAGCTDLGRLDSWIRRAATATTIQDLFD